MKIIKRLVTDGTGDITEQNREGAVNFLYNLPSFRLRVILRTVYKKGGLRVFICIRCARTRFVGQ